MQPTKIRHYLTMSWLVASLMLLVAPGCGNSSSDTGCPGNKNPWANCESETGGNGGSNAGGSSSGSNTGGNGGSSGNASMTCDFPLAQCYNGPCTDLRTDKDNCGACGFDCGDAATCVNATCKTICQPTGPEICDGKDNNCDGTIDEGLKNLCGTCGVVPAEECDGLDNDCDGTIDNGCPCQEGHTMPCGTTLGECTTGSQKCIDGEWSLCSGNPPEVETCNGKDDNCDGTIDNGCECVAGDQRSCGTDTGSCSKGMQTCVAGHWGTCSGIAPV
ncbi:hypothetical protein IT412_00205, partial [Candidatus Peregrinibacteria bacterium]|nr:hypothetical protein [Candidatus Peregrinibacteria bacterium]